MTLYLEEKYPRSIRPIIIMVDVLLLTNRLHGSLRGSRGFGSHLSEGPSVHF